MEYKTTKKDIMYFYKNIIKIGYCQAQYLLGHLAPSSYTRGVYGWNADVYHISNNTAICTGYRPFGNIEVNYDVLKKYEDLARENGNSEKYLAEFLKEIQA